MNSQLITSTPGPLNVSQAKDQKKRDLCFKLCFMAWLISMVLGITLIFVVTKLQCMQQDVQNTWEHDQRCQLICGSDFNQGVQLNKCCNINEGSCLTKTECYTQQNSSFDTKIEVCHFSISFLLTFNILYILYQIYKRLKSKSGEQTQFQNLNDSLVENVICVESRIGQSKDKQARYDCF